MQLSDVAGGGALTVGFIGAQSADVPQYRGLSNSSATRITVMSMPEEQLRAALQVEYLQLQKIIEDFDSRALTIKAWSVTFSLSAIAGAFASHAAPVLMVSAISAILFWYIEASWKSFQYAFYDRAGAIEKYFRGEKNAIAPFQIGSSWNKRWTTGGYSRLWKIVLWPHVALPHAAIFLVASILYVLSLSGHIEL